MVNNKALLLEVLLSGFFAVACVRARGSGVEARCSSAAKLFYASRTDWNGCVEHDGSGFQWFS